MTNAVLGGRLFSGRSHVWMGEGTRSWLNHGRGLYQLRLEIPAAVDSAEPVVLSRLVDVGFAGVTGLTVLVR